MLLETKAPFLQLFIQRTGRELQEELGKQQEYEIPPSVIPSQGAEVSLDKDGLRFTVTFQVYLPALSLITKSSPNL